MCFAVCVYCGLGGCMTSLGLHTRRTDGCRRLAVWGLSGVSSRVVRVAATAVVPVQGADVEDYAVWR